MKKKIFIQYTVYSRVREARCKGYTYRSGTMWTIMDWDSDSGHTRLRNRIRKKHPGWILQGYCEAKPPVKAAKHKPR